MYTLKQDHNLNKLGEAPQGEVTYERSRLYALWDRARSFFYPKTYAYDPWWGHFNYR